MLNQIYTFRKHGIQTICFLEKLHTKNCYDSIYQYFFQNMMPSSPFVFLMFLLWKTVFVKMNEAYCMYKRSRKTWKHVLIICFSFFTTINFSSIRQIVLGNTCWIYEDLYNLAILPLREKATNIYYECHSLKLNAPVIFNFFSLHYIDGVLDYLKISRIVHRMYEKDTYLKRYFVSRLGSF